ncbi:MAG: type II secretion system protein [Lachnospiraceae bacterium]|nr:type II secretion system protein [Lachnospiraceae bacterium]
MKNDNKGFSLVELIVVVLIMAIVAVALAPQVMKWVQNSRIASDLQTKADIEKMCSLAITDNNAFDCVKDGGYEIILTKDEMGISYSYNIKNSLGGITPYVGSQPPMDAFWESLFEVCGVSDFDEFEDAFVIKSAPTDGNEVILDVHVYEGGYTFSTMSGVISDTIELD